jgi:hypothetical protein
MTDAQFQKSIDKTMSLLVKYKSALKIAENEYERRYGANPSEIDDNYWIDSLHIGYGSRLTVDTVERNAKDVLSI